MDGDDKMEQISIPKPPAVMTLKEHNRLLANAKELSFDEGSVTALSDYKIKVREVLSKHILDTPFRCTECRESGCSDGDKHDAEMMTAIKQELSL